MSGIVSRRKIPLGRIVRVTIWALLIAGAMLLMGITMIASVGGTDDSLRRGMEQFLGNATGLQTSIGKLNGMEFYPDIVVDMENVDFRRGEKGPVAMHMGRLRANMRFWDMAFSTGYMTEFHIENMKADAGILAPEAVDLGQMDLGRDERGPRLVASGKYGSLPASLRIDAQAVETWRKLVIYRFFHGGDFEARVGDFSVSGKVSKPRFAQGFIVDPLRIGAPEQAASGKVSYIKTWTGWVFDGDIRTGATKLRPDLTFGEGKEKDLPSGTIDVPDLHVADFGREGPAGHVLSALKPLLPEYGDGALKAIMTGIEKVGALGEGCRAAMIEIDKGMLAETRCTQPSAGP